jgi:Flp pilus assembly protein TadD
LLAETQLAVGQLDEAEEHFRRVLAQRPDEVRARFGMGLVTMAREDWKASRDHFLRCLSSPVARQKASVQLAAVSQRLGDTAAADRYRAQAEHSTKDLEWSDPYMAELLNWAVKKRTRYRYVEQLQASGRHGEALSVVQSMTEEYPDDYYPQMLLAKHFLQIGDLGRAERSLRRALQLAPDKVRVRYYLSLALKEKGEEAERNGDAEEAKASFREAAEQAREALLATPDNGPAYMCLGVSLKHLGERPGAIVALRRAVRCNPELAELHYYLGDILADDGQGAEARHYLQQSLEFAPPNAAWRQAAVARLAALKGKP